MPPTPCRASEELNEGPSVPGPEAASAEAEALTKALG
jgi:hypothetical protein